MINFNKYYIKKKTKQNKKKKKTSFSLHEITRNLIARALADHDTITTGHATLLSYISTREFLRTREKCREARAVGECS